MGRLAFFLACAVAVLSNSTIVTPSHAGSILGSIVTVNSELSTIPAGVTSITELDVTFTGIPPLSDLTLVTPRTSTGATISSVGDEIQVSIPPAVSTAYIDVFGQAFGTFNFVVPGNGTDIAATSTMWVTNQGDISGRSSVFVTPIPEPSSISLLGLGMVGLFAVHRTLKSVHQ